MNTYLAANAIYTSSYKYSPWVTFFQLTASLGTVTVTAYTCTSTQRISNTFIAMYKMSKCVTLYSETVWIQLFSKLIKWALEWMHLHTCIVPVFLLVTCFDTKQNPILCVYAYIWDNCITEYIFVLNNLTSKTWQGVHLISQWDNEVTHKNYVAVTR